jgi:putative ubiquitin-RnfH superfamily antitoxin RatB of RatAB toxin-antitoxin module
MPSPEPAIEVAYARADRQWVVRMPLRDGLTALGAVEASGLLEECPELAAQPLVLGIHGQRADGARVLRDADRVEIYRPLRNDPRDARRRAARPERPGRRASAPADRR